MVRPADVVRGPRGHGVSAGGILLAAGFLRFWRLGCAFFYSDESFSWRVAEKPLGELLCRVAGDTHPPGHFLLEKAWMGVFGETPLALRGLSAACGCLAVVVVYALVIEACRSAKEPARRARAGALVAALLVAIHPAQVHISRTARMYSLGVLIAAVSAWLLLRAMRAERREMPWWTAYGVSAAIFLYVHNFAVFALAAQFAYVAGRAVWSWRQRRTRDESPTPGVLDGGVEKCAAAERYDRWMIGVGWAAAVALLLYAPWVPVFLAQASRVRAGFWIQPLTLEELGRALVVWITGSEKSAPADAMFWAAMLCLLAMWTVWRRPAGALFFLLQAASPWVFALAISTWGGRPVLQDRYLAFGQVAFIAFLGVAFAGLRSAALRWLLAGGTASACLIALHGQVRQWPAAPPPIAQAASRLAEEYREGDVVLVPRPSDVNCLRYYTQQAGKRTMDVRCLRGVLRYGHVNHISALEAKEVLRDANELSPFERLWEADDVPPTRSVTGPADPEARLVKHGDSEWTVIKEQRFVGRAGNGAYYLALCVRADHSNDGNRQGLKPGAAR